MCYRPTTRRVACERCRSELVPAAERLLPGGLRVVGAFEHTGAARTLVHHLKYRGVAGYPEMVAEAICERVPGVPLVPIPRAVSRRLKYGVDPALVIARAIASITGAPVLSLLKSPLHTERRAGGDHRRPVRSYRGAGARFPVVLVDDVVTTGATLLAAAESLGGATVTIAVAANVVPGATLARPRVPTKVDQWHQL